ncbi:c2h2 finger domain containing protein [Sporothrix brasiliensis 5110]|uniref:C2h2 finger domain containing protein n=1 Tax=Sporothrix brasiliensis 5110 TaxID=1398154 RepID=A0A0C2IYS5_9PEZI|nr:c2h2 finger domain containing protein [Sporothrix brasiliensis 5110]KIH91865.1 c2h2 finger domain containing protein [Sporothrix brasiliensis 5110]
MLYLGAQPGTTASMSGGQWDGAVEGTQNFADFSDQGDLAQDSDEYAYQRLDEYRLQQQQMQQSRTPRPETKWAALGPAGAAAATAGATSVPMHRTVSKSSASSFKSRTIRASSHKSRPRVQASLSAPLYGATPSAPSVYNIQAYYNSSTAAAAGGGMSPDQYLALYSQGLGSATYGTAEGAMPTYNTDLAASLGSNLHNQQQQQHVDPTCTQMNMDGFDLESLNGLDNMVFDPSHTPISPQTWASSSSRRSSPDRAQVEAAAGRKRTTSGLGRISSSSSGGGNNMDQSNNGDDASTSSSSRRQSEGESARDHPLYKTAACHPDGLYHCPWEGEESCNHKPEKLKCNYDKFVDSHLKPYRCKNTACENARFSSTACLLRHEREAHAMHGHGDKPYLCPHPECDRAQPGFGFPRQWNLKDHMRRVHHDDGSQLEHMAAAAGTAVDAAPMAVSSSQAVSKGRKRKKDTAATSTSASSRKGSSSSSKSGGSSGSGSSSSSSSHHRDAESRRHMQELAAMEAAHKLAVDKSKAEWHHHKDMLSNVVMKFSEPDDPEMLAQLQAAQIHFDAISRISTEMISSSSSSQQYYQTYPQ